MGRDEIVIVWCHLEISNQAIIFGFWKRLSIGIVGV
jgi:hypothetical protein